MTLFKKSSAVFIEKMNRLENVTVSEDKVMFQLNYSNIEVYPKDIPKLVSDFIQIYGIVKPTLDKISSAESEAKVEQSPEYEPIDLSDIPF